MFSSLDKQKQRQKERTIKVSHIKYIKLSHRMKLYLSRSFQLESTIDPFQCQTLDHDKQSIYTGAKRLAKVHAYTECQKTYGRYRVLHSEANERN